MTKLCELEEGTQLPLSKRFGAYEVELKGGETYKWCSCGLSDTQPFCDGSHEGTGFEPVELKAPLSNKYFLCGCKHSDNKPHCYGNCRGLNAANARKVSTSRGVG